MTSVLFIEIINKYKIVCSISFWYMTVFFFRFINEGKKRDKLCNVTSKRLLTLPFLDSKNL